MPTLQFYTVDAFADIPFSGNPAAVVLLEKALAEDIYLKIANEMNLSETAFVIRREQDKTLSFVTGSQFILRWFTPAAEVALCGHATLATAHVIFNVLGNKNDSLSFATKSGELVCTQKGDFISMDFPQYTPNKVTTQTYPDLFHGNTFVDWLTHLIEEAVSGLSVDFIRLCPISKKLLIVLSSSHSRQDLEEMSPNTEKLRSLHASAEYIKGVCVTLKGSESNGGLDEVIGLKFDFLSRYFAPWVGIPEDPATGSAHCVLGPYWAERLSKRELYARQCSKRGANLKLILKTDGRMEICGKGVVVLEGRLSF